MAAARPLPLLLAPSPLHKPFLVSSIASASDRNGRTRRTKPLRLLWLRRRADAAAELGTAPIEQAESVVRAASDDDGIAAAVVSSLLTLAFVGLSLLTIGVIYLSVQDFLRKREREKFEKEEAERMKEEARKKKAKARARKRR